MTNRAVNQVLWKKKMTRMPIEAYTQKDLRAGSEVVAPTPKAMKSVMEVMVIATPAWDMLQPILSTTGKDFSFSERVFLHCTITNMSSMPIPSMRKGSTVCAALRKDEYHVMQNNKVCTCRKIQVLSRFHSWTLFPLLLQRFRQS